MREFGHISRGQEKLRKKKKISETIQNNPTKFRKDRRRSKKSGRNRENSEEFIRIQENVGETGIV